MTEKFKEYRIVRMDITHLKKLQSLTKAVWGYIPAYETLYLRYYHPEPEFSFLGYLALGEKENAVGFQGAICQWMAYGTEKERVAQSADVMTHPEHSGKGLVILLANKTYQLCHNQGIKAMFAFPNQNYLKIVTQKLWFTVSDYLQGYTIPIFTLPLEKIGLKITFLQKVYAYYLEFIFRKYKIPHQIPYSFSKNEFPILLREETLIPYKLSRGVFTVKIKNTLLWVKIQRGFFVGDLQCPDEEEWISVMQKLKKLCFGRGFGMSIFNPAKGPRKSLFFKSIMTPFSLSLWFT